MQPDFRRPHGNLRAVTDPDTLAPPGALALVAGQ
jgi:hypothetical protein